MNDSLPQVLACGFLVMRRQPCPDFLLMRHPKRLDLPKGHADPGETEIQCALRELFEETGIEAHQLQVDPDFRFETSYKVHYKKKFGGGNAWKTLVIFLGRLTTDVEISLTEHQGCQWIPWQPPHRIQQQTIDPLLAYAERFFGPQGPFPSDWQSA